MPSENDLGYKFGNPYLQDPSYRHMDTLGHIPSDVYYPRSNYLDTIAPLTKQAISQHYLNTDRPAQRQTNDQHTAHLTRAHWQKSEFDSYAYKFSNMVDRQNYLRDRVDSDLANTTEILDNVNDLISKSYVNENLYPLEFQTAKHHRALRDIDFADSTLSKDQTRQYHGPRYDIQEITRNLEKMIDAKFKPMLDAS